MPGNFGIALEQEEIKPIARRAGFLTLDLTDWDAGSSAVELMLREGDPHTNAAGHERIASVLVGRLLSKRDLWNTGVDSSLQSKSH